MQDIVTFRPRGGRVLTVDAGDAELVSLPHGTRHVLVSCTENGGRVAVGTSDTVPDVSDGRYGFLQSGIPMTIKLGSESQLYLGGGTEGCTFFVTFGN